MKGAFYGRHSTDKQNLDSQLSSAYDFAEKYECEIVGDYFDEGISSRKKDRDGLKLLLKDANEGKFDFIIIYSHSRLARMPEEHDTLRITMSVLGIHIVESSTETLYSYGDIVYSSIKDALAKYELDTIRKNTKNSIKSLAKQGLWTGGRAPFGYKYYPKIANKKNRKGERESSSTVKEIEKLLPNDMAATVKSGRFESFEDELILVKDVFTLYKEGYGFTQIADQLPENSYRGKNWDKDKVKQIIINPFYAGYIAIRKRNLSSRNTINSRDEWEMNKSSLIKPIITLAEWEECFELYEQRKEKKLPPNFYRTSFYLSNLLVCKHCSQQMKGKDQRSNGYGDKIYLCKGCNFKVIAIEKDGTGGIHESVFQLLSKLQAKNTNEIVEAIQNKITNESVQIQEKVNILLERIEEEKKKLYAIKLHIDKLFSKEVEQTVIKILYVAEETLQNSINEKTKRLEDYKTILSKLNNIEANDQYIEKKILDFKQMKDLSDVRLRRLFLYLIENILVDKKGNLECKLRFNLELDSFL
jgi:site-specific DNA recombinase